MRTKEGKGGKMAIAPDEKTYTTTIKVDDDGNFTYDNPLIWVYPGNTIIWQCANNCPFAIHIGWNSPVKGRYCSVDGTAIEAPVPVDARPGYYSYTVAVFDEKTRKIWTDDPPFIVKKPKKH
jgi:hypothetical protein